MSRSRSDRATRRHRGWRGLLGTALLALALVLPVASAVAQDRTAAWLESKGLDELLARHLENDLAAAQGDQGARARIAGRLALTYARLLGRVEDDDRRAAIVERSGRIIDIVPRSEVGELRIALVRNRYVRASRIMEDDRVGAAEADEVAQAVEELAALAVELDGVRQNAIKEAEQESRAQGRRVDERIERQLELAAAAGLLEGWTRYYVGIARKDRRQLELAQLALGSVLRGESPIPDAEEVSIDLQMVESFANAVLANAMVTSAVDSPAVAAKWFDRLDMSVTHDAVRRSAPGWRLASLIEAGDFEDAEAYLRELIERARTEGESALPVGWIRLAAVGAMRRTSSTPAAMPIAQLALATLAARGELGQVRGLAADFGLDALGDSGFIFGYVRGLEQHRLAGEAREAGDDAAAQRGYSEAITLLRGALEEPDAGNFADSVGSATLIIAWSLFEVGRVEEAADAFEQAAESMTGKNRSNAMWGAIVALDRLVAEGGDQAPAVVARRDALAERFLDAFPADERAPSLVIRRLAEEENPDDEDLALLLGVPRNHPNWETARRRAVQSLYERFRAAQGEARAAAGVRMLDAADELLQRDRAEDALFTDMRGLDGMLLRQAAEVASDEDVHEASRAESYIDRLQAAFDGGAMPGLPDLPNEMQHRRLGVALGDGDFTQAEVLLRAMPVAASAPEAARWLRLGALRLHNAAMARMRETAVTIDVARAGAEAGTRYLELLGRLDEDETAADDGDSGAEPPDRFAVLDRERFLPTARNVADARKAMYDFAGDRADGEEALAWYRAILERRPLDGAVLQSTAELAESLGQADVALDSWRRLVRAAPDGDERWWRAKVGQIRTLLGIDAVAAREVLDQVRTLHPDLGPEPWRALLRELDVRIDVTLGREAIGVDTPASGGSEADG